MELNKEIEMDDQLIIRRLKSHGVDYKIINGVIWAEDDLFGNGTTEKSSEPIYTLQECYEWLGY